MQNPPLTITENIINLVSEISEYIGVVSVNSKNKINPYLRKDNQIKTIHSSLAIENNSLSLEQVTDIISGKRVLGIADKESESTVFVEFMLTAIRDSLKELREVQENK